MAIWKQLDIYVKESDLWHQKRLWLALIEVAQEQRMAGATATRSLAGFGRSKVCCPAEILSLSIDPSIVVTVIDSEEAIAQFLVIIQKMIQSRFATLQIVEVFTPNVRASV